MDGTTGSSPIDGRTMRRTRNREKVLDAVLDIFEEGTLDPSIDDVAERAGVSNRSIYRYFDDRDDLILSSMNHALRRVGPDLMVPSPGVGSFDERVRRFVDHRLWLYGRMAAITRAAKLASVTEPLIAEQFEMSRLMLRQEFINHFAPEFDKLAPGDRTRAVIAAELPFQFESLEFLAQSTNGIVEEIRMLLVDQLTMCLGRFRTTVSCGASDDGSARSDAGRSTDQ